MEPNGGEAETPQAGLHFHAALIRSYRPSPLIPWSEKIPLESSIMGYADPDVHSEFMRFANRDLASIMCGIVFGIGGAVYSALNVWHLSFEMRIVAYTVGAAAALFVAFDVFTLLQGAFTIKKGQIRTTIAIVYALICMNATSYGVTYSFAKCDCANNYLHDWEGRNTTVDEARYAKYCAEVTNPYVAVCLGVAFSTIRLQPAVATLLCVLYFGLFYAGYAITDLPGESSRDLVGKLMIYLTCAGASLALNFTRFSALRTQFEQSVNVAVEAYRSLLAQESVETLLGAMVPPSVLERISSGETVLDYANSATVLFSDIVGFTQWSSSRTPLLIAQMLNSLCVEFDHVAVDHGIEKVKTIGDAYWAVCGLPEPTYDHAHVMCSFGVTMVSVLRAQNAKNPAWGNIRIRVGVDTGRCHGAVFGRDRLSYEVFGPASERAHHCESKGHPMCVCIGDKCRVALNTTMEMEDHGTIDVPGDVTGYSLYLLPTSYPPLHQSEHTTKTHSGSIGRQNSFDSQGSWSRQSGRSGSARTGEAPITALTPQRGITSPGSGGPARLSALTMSEIPGASQSVMTFDTNAPGGGGYGAMRVSNAAKRHQKQFLAARRERQAAMAEGDAASLELVEDRYSRRRYNWILMTFADEEIETQYQDFVRQVHHPLRKVTRAALCLLIVAVIVSFPIQGSEAVPGAGTWALLAVALALSIVITAVSFNLGPLAELAETQQTGCADAFVMHLVASLLVISCGLASGYGTPVTSSTLAGNDLTYAHAALTPLLTFGISCMPSALIVAGNAIFVIAPIMGFVYDSVTWTADVGFLGLSLLFAAFGAIISEKLHRRQFLEDAIMRHHRKEQDDRVAEQRVVLAAILPPFVIDDVLEWLATGFDPKLAIVQLVRPSVVAFIQLQQPPASPASASRMFSSAKHRPDTSSSASSGAATPVPHEMVLTVPPAAAAGDPADSPDLITRVPHPEEHYARAAVSPRNNPMANASASRAALVTEEHWLLRAHRLVDELLKTELGFCIKIKTIGDLILLAGPFGGDDDAYDDDPCRDEQKATSGKKYTQDGKFTSTSLPEGQRAADEMLVALAKALEATAGFATAGAHAGSCVGTVLGTSRLCFDIFGDAVNTASRVLSTSSVQLEAAQNPLGVVVSENFLLLYAGLLEDDGEGAGGPRSTSFRAKTLSSPRFPTGDRRRQSLSLVLGQLEDIDDLSPMKGVDAEEDDLDLIADANAASPTSSFRGGDGLQNRSFRRLSSATDPEMQVMSDSKLAASRALPAEALVRVPFAAADGATQAAHRSAGTSFGPLVQLTAKGKGSIAARAVTSFPKHLCRTDRPGSSGTRSPCSVTSEGAAPVGTEPSPILPFRPYVAPLANVPSMAPEMDEDKSADSPVTGLHSVPTRQFIAKDAALSWSPSASPNSVPVQ